MTVNSGFKRDDETPPEVYQVGLYSEDAEEIKTFVERVAKFNERFSTNIKVDVQVIDDGSSRANLAIRFPSYEVQDKFWLE